jgi:hypothetical protein
MGLVVVGVRPAYAERAGPGMSVCAVSFLHAPSLYVAYGVTAFALRSCQDVEGALDGVREDVIVSGPNRSKIIVIRYVARHHLVVVCRWKTARTHVWIFGPRGDQTTRTLCRVMKPS